MRRLGLIHTVSKLAPTFDDLVARLLPGVDTVVIADELLLKRAVRSGSVDGTTQRRLQEHVAALSEFDVDAVLVTCSSVGGLVDQIAPGSAVPVIRVDQAMAEQAVTLGGRIGVLATLSTTLEPTTELIERTATAAGRNVDVVSRVCAGAFEALDAGDVARHDAMVADELTSLASEVDVVVLAQASMARIAATLPELDIPVLSSPRLAVESLADRSEDEGSAPVEDTSPVRGDEDSAQVGASR